MANDPIEIVRQRLLQLKQERGLTNKQLAACIKKRNGEQYSWGYTAQFLEDSKPSSAWGELATNIVRAFPRIGDGIVCPTCEQLVR